MALFTLARAQTGHPVRLVGTVSAVKSEGAEVEIKPENGAALIARWTADTVAQRIAPGEKDLGTAQPMSAAEISAGDRVLVVLKPGTNEIRRVVVMPVNDIEKRDEADRQDWMKRGVSGVVAANNGNQITFPETAPTVELAWALQ